MMLEGIQKKLQLIGEYGCYLLTLMKVGKLTEDEIPGRYETYLLLKYIDRECTVLRPTDILFDLTGEKYNVVKSTVFDSKADIIIALWYNPRTGFRHFVLMNKRNEVEWDSLGRSVTVAEGYIESYRLFYLQ